MTTAPIDLATLHRPRLLITAARFGLADYARTRDLRQALRCGVMTALPDARAAVDQLVVLEAMLEGLRVAHDAAYRPARHVAVLTALLAEWQVAYGAVDNVVALCAARDRVAAPAMRRAVGG
ncbi:DUF6477 family protein [Roseicitreum antarcticum]|uniref:Uncharacterized protein n=1 Tax=Roseicitreum antarcticum TaxID=564137 RepID=A0A1H3BFI8_9RHOB|nr:DUF6477 family protein [Roseicitreum antarcticum]SDX40703.1 hypothetical protein SAMN04488238_10836 [Roseicitreum antarcticum]